MKLQNSSSLLYSNIFVLIIIFQQQELQKDTDVIFWRRCSDKLVILFSAIFHFMT